MRPGHRPPRMTSTLRSRRSSSSPSHSRTDFGQPCTAALRRCGAARVNGIARPSRNGRCQSSRRRGRVRGAARASHRGDTPSGIASGSLRAWFATANATSRKTRAGWRSLLRTSARPSPWRRPQASGLASVSEPADARTTGLPRIDNWKRRHERIHQRTTSNRQRVPGQQAYSQSAQGTQRRVSTR